MTPNDESGPLRHVVVGARGGQGATTIATALAGFSSHQQPTTLVAHDPDAVCGMVGLASAPLDGPVQLAPNLTLDKASGRSAPVTVVDAGPLRSLGQAAEGSVDPRVDERRWLVVRGPCYLSLRTAVTHPWRPDGVIVVTEPHRALSDSDVARVLDAPVVAQLPQNAGVARAVDAGTLLTTVGRQDALTGLWRLVADAGAPVPALLEGPAPDPGTHTQDTARRMSHQLDALEHPTSGIDPTLER